MASSYLFSSTICRLSMSPRNRETLWLSSAARMRTQWATSSSRVTVTFFTPQV